MKINRLAWSLGTLFLSLSLLAVSVALADSSDHARETADVTEKETEEIRQANESGSFAPETTGGPDGFGYTFADSNEPGGPIYSFVNITSTGTNVPLGDETRHGPYSLGFTFNYYGVDYGDVWLGSNGWMTVGATDPGSADLTNDCPLPNTFGNDNLIAGIWDDLDNDTDPAAPGTGYYQSFAAGTCPYDGYGGACFVAQWEGMYHYLSSPADDMTFEMILFDDNDIVIQMEDASNEAGSGSTTGIENADATIGLTYACNTAASLTDSLAIQFYYPQPAPRFDASYKGGPISVTPGDPITYTIYITNSGTLPSTNTTLTDTIPAGTTYVAGSVSCSSGACSYDGATDSVVWNGGVAIGEALTVTFAVDTAGGICGASVDNTATLADPAALGSPYTLSHSTSLWDNSIAYDFEADNGGFAGTNDWEWGVPTYPAGLGAHSGVNVWATVLDGPYNNLGDSSILTQTIDLSGVPPTANLSWWQYLNTGNSTFDYGRVLLNGAELYNSSGTGDTEWTLHEASLAPYVGGLLDLEFNFFATTVVNNDGWYVDDVAVLYCNAPDSPDLGNSSKSAPGTAGTGSSFDYTVSINNIASVTATNSSLVDPIPAGATYVPGSVSSGATYNAGLNQIEWTGDVGPATTVDVSFAVTATALSGAITNTATISQSQIGEPVVVTATTTILPNEPLVCNGTPVAFESGIPGDWTVVDNTGGAGIVWVTTADPACAIANLTNGSGEAACADSDAAGSGAPPYDTELVSPPFDLTGYNIVTLDAAGYYNDLGVGNDLFEVDVWDGVSWTNLLTWDEDHTPGDISLDMSGYGGMTDVQIRFGYSGNGFDWYAEVDDVSLFCDVGVDPDIVVDPTSLDSTQPANIAVTATLTISNVGYADLTWDIEESPAGVGSLGGWSDNFDSYAPGSQMHGQGGWKGWFNDPAAGALVSNAQSNSAPNSVEIVGASDLVREFTGYDSGQWTMTAWQHVPVGFSGQTYFILLNTYDDSGVGLNWSTQVSFDSATNLVTNDGISGGTLPLVTGQWVEIRVEIDLVNDTQDFYYNNQLLFSGTWTDELSGDGALSFDTIDLFANNASAVYYDDLLLTEVVPTGCDAPADIPWISVSPDSGTTPAGDATDVTVTFDSTGLAPATYDGTLCVNSNDPETPTVEVPLSLEVIGAPVIQVDPDAITSTQAPDVTAVLPLTITNAGDLDLTWTIEEEPATGATVNVQTPTGVLYDNGPLVTHPGGGAGGADASALQTALGLNVYGFGHALTSGFRIADEFTITDPGGWTIDTITFWAYQSFAGPPSTIDHVNLQIWLGSPDDPDSRIVFGDTTTNRLASSTWDNLYRVLDTSLTNTDRPVMAQTVTVGTTLGPGTYWLDWQTGGTATSGPWAPPVSILGQTTTGNALQFDGSAWAAVLDSGTGTPQDFPFVLDGAVAAACDTGDIPWASLSTTSGTTLPGDSSVVDVTLDSVGLATGVYTGTLCVTSNDAQTPTVYVPLTLTVELPLPVPSIVLTKTVGLGSDPANCTSDELTTQFTAGGVEVIYCYDVTNTGNVTLTLHTLDDSLLGNVFSDLPYDLGPGASTQMTATTTLTATGVFTNVATWTATDGAQLSATATDSATVTIEVATSVGLASFAGGRPAALLPLAVALALLLASAMILRRRIIRG